MLDSEHRRALCALVAFSHRANDFADAERYAGRRLECLDRWEAMLFAAYHGQAEHPVFVGLRAAAEQHDIPITDLCSLLDGHRLDLAHTRYSTFADYRTFCERSAEPIGRLLLRVMGNATPQLLRYSDPLCVGLRITDDLRDVAEDFARGRIYLPLEDLEHFGVDESRLAQSEPSSAMKALFAFEACRARSFLLRGRPLIDIAPSQVRPYFEAVLHAGLRTLHRFDE
jgi:phytoene/squalene synthetase